jgi:hypothetical protein
MTNIQQPLAVFYRLLASSTQPTDINGIFDYRWYKSGTSGSKIIVNFHFTFSTKG